MWDSWDRWWNHSDVVSALKDLNIVSAYHSIFNEVQGKESQKTFFLQKNHSKSYHIDYCFLPKQLIQKLESVHIEFFEDWRTLSDHVPLVVTSEKPFLYS